MNVTEMRKKEKKQPKFRVSGGARLPAVRGPGALGLCGQPRNPGQALVPRSWVYPRSVDRGRHVRDPCLRDFRCAARWAMPKIWRPQACPTATRPTCGWLCLAHWPGTHPGRSKGATRGCVCVYIGHLRRARPGRQPPKPVQNRLSVIQQINLFQFSCGCFSSVVYCSLPIKKKAALAVKKGGLPFRDKHSAVEPGWWVHTPRIAQCTRREKLI